MSVSNELSRPATDDEFEGMCHALYKRMWGDVGCMRVGRSGQKQFGFDIVGHDGKKSIGIQCKHYIKTPFTRSVIANDIAEADSALTTIEHFLFATTVVSDALLVLQVHAISEERRKQGKFTVSVDFWGDISGHIRLHPEIGRAYVPDFPGSTLRKIEEVVNKNLTLSLDECAAQQGFRASSSEHYSKVEAALNVLLVGKEPIAQGDEADPRVVRALDYIRDRLLEDKSLEALSLLQTLGDPKDFRDKFSRFRWHTNHAAANQIEGCYEEAAAEFLLAFDLAPESEKAHANRAYAYLLQRLPVLAIDACNESLKKFPENVSLLALKMNAQQMLGVVELGADIPSALLDSPTLLFMQARLAEKRGDFEDAIAMLRRCLALECESKDVKRAFLSCALGWVTAKPLVTHNRQFTEVQRNALRLAIECFEPLEETLPTIQSKHVSEEVTNNVCVSLLLLGEDIRAAALATLTLNKHPLSEGLLKIRMGDLDRQDDMSGIRALTDSRLEELPIDVLRILCQIAANRGNVVWFDSVKSIAETRRLEPDALQELRVLSILSHWSAGNRTEAMASARAYVLANPNHVVARVLLGQMLNEQGKVADALNEATECASRIPANSQSLEVIQTADLLFDLKQFVEAGTLYRRLLVTPANDRLTIRTLASLIESDQRQKAQLLFARITPAIQDLRPFRRIEVNLARLMGDWARMKNVLEKILNDDPTDARAAVGYVSALYRLDETETLSTYLNSNPKFPSAEANDEFELSKYQIMIGSPDLGMARLYKLFRRNSGSTKIAGFYLGTLITTGQSLNLGEPIAVIPGSVVRLKNNAGIRVIAIDTEPPEPSNAWPELTLPNSATALQLIGLKVGDTVALSSDFFEQDYKVVGVENIYRFAAEKAQKQIDAAATPDGPLFSVRVIMDDGEPDFDGLLKSATRRREYVQSTMQLYKQYRFPLAMLAKRLGTDPVTLLVDWPSKESTLFVGFGSQEERDNSLNILSHGHCRYVVDLITLAELVLRKTSSAIVNVVGKPLVPQTVREHLKMVMQSIYAPVASATLGARDGQLQLTDVPASYHEVRRAFLGEILSFIDNYCDVVPTVGPIEIADSLRELARNLDHDTLDVLYLCLERDAVLLSEDGALRLWATSAGLLRSVGIQPVLMRAQELGFISRTAYATVVSEKIADGHDFVSIQAGDLLALANQSPTRISEKVTALLETFRKPTIDIVSCVGVSCEFLAQVTQKLPAAVAVKYGKKVLDVLQHERLTIARDIQDIVGYTFKDALKNTTHKLKPSERRAFGELMKVSTGPTLDHHMSPIAAAIKKMYKRYSG
jgi:tetratricopeptide (TPR) repeat protein